LAPYDTFQPVIVYIERYIYILYIYIYIGLLGMELTFLEFALLACLGMELAFLGMELTLLACLGMELAFLE